MEPIYIRNSALGSLDFCEHRYFLEYGLGVRMNDNKSAIIGTCVHKCLECLAQKKLAEQNDEEVFYNDELGLIPFHCNITTPDDILEVVFPTYKEKYPDLDESDKKKCRSSIRNLLDLSNGDFDPANQDIISPEVFFDIEIEKPWAKLSDGSYLRIKGTIDLIVKVDDDTYNLIDYKTGKPWNWSTDQEKNYEKLTTDTQLALYHFCACHLYPDVENFLMSMVFMNYDKYFTIPFSREDLPKTEKMLRKYFERIKNIKKPRLTETWKCSKFCFKKMMHESGKDTCTFYKDEVNKKGMEIVINEYADRELLGKYTGGGRTEK